MDSQGRAVPSCAGLEIESGPVMRLLVLGGTSEASALAQALADRPDLQATLSLAGRTAAPVRPVIDHRIGGFGGVEGLCAWLTREGADAVIDATHPFAARISANAVAACNRLRLPLLTFGRPAWAPVAGDHWIDVDDVPAAVRALGPVSRRVFVTTGRLELDAFAAAPQHHYVARMIDPPATPPALPDCTIVYARGPFALADELKLLDTHRIDIVVSKNAGGDATYAKIAAARARGLPVVMVRRPAAAPGTQAATVAEVLRWIDDHRPGAGTPRGV